MEMEQLILLNIMGSYYAGGDKSQCYKSDKSNKDDFGVSVVHCPFNIYCPS